MKILLIHNEYQQPGGEDVVFEQERDLLRRAGHQVFSYARSNKELERLTPLHKALVVPQTIWSGSSHKSVQALLQEQKPQVVHVHNTLPIISPSVYWACADAGIPVVQTLHNFRLFCPAATFYRKGQVCEECVEHSLWRGVRYGCYRQSRAGTATIAAMLSVHRWLGTWERKVTTYIAFHQFARNKCVQGGLPPEKITIKPNFVYPDPGPRANGPGSFALFVGRLSAEKGVGTLLEAWRRLPQQVPLQIVGDGPLRGDLQASAARMGLAQVRFLGRLSREETIAAMQQARFLVFPSEWYEGFPVTIAEAFACGLPVIGSRLGAMEELVADGRTGLHFKARDAEDLADKVLYAWDNPECTRRMGQEARAEYLSRYTADANYPILMRIYERSLACHV